MKENTSILAQKTKRVSKREVKIATRSSKRSVSDLSPGKTQETRKRTAFGDITNAIQAHSDRMALARKKCTKQEIKPPIKTKARRQSNIVTRNRSKVSNTSCTQNKTQQLINENIPLNHDKKVDNELAQSSIMDKSVDKMNVSCSSTSSTKSRPVPVIPTEILEKVALDIQSPINPKPDDLKPYDQEFQDPFLVAEYAETIFKNMRKRENKYVVINYLSREDSLTTGPMRAILVDWLVEVQENFELYHETLYLAVKLVDNFLQKVPTPKEHLQLVGATALLIACKLEERHPPPIDDFQYICDDAYTHKMFVSTEIKILKALHFDLNVPIAYRFLRRYARVTSMSMQTLTLSRYISELALHEAPFVDVRASKLAAACLCLALKMKEEVEWDTNLCYHAGYTEKELTVLTAALNTMVMNASKSKLQTVRTKYLHPIFFEVAKIPAVDPLFL